MSQRVGLLIVALAWVLAACTSLPSVATPTPAVTTPTPTPLPTWTPTPTPTATPEPSLRLSIHWPDRVSPLDELRLAVELASSTGDTLPATVHATVVDPRGQVYAEFALLHESGARYVSATALHLPLFPDPGAWWLVIRVEAPVEVQGPRILTFRPEPAAFRDLSEVLPSQVTLRVPEQFAEVRAQGGLWAGSRAWRYGEGELALWWAPGPTQAFTADNALVMLEATHDAEFAPEVYEFEPLEWQGRTAYRFEERLPDGGGQATAWVFQDAGYWLYVLRVRALDARAVTDIHREVAATFAFAE